MRKDWIGIDGAVNSVQHFCARGRLTYSVSFTYEVDGRIYSGTIPTFEEYRADDRISLSYDPNDPSCNNCVEDQKNIYRITWIVVFVFLAIVIAGTIFVMRYR